ncbi:SDR family NAD(P)-dependent oxidoreductase [Corynebacterium sp. 4HC-13]|uniref:SDR family NAD(P)-dependent oxidoreductase n=1 Tax=Corynebacterium anserum TaxID=2684406 RepID=UPI00163AAACC|nr:SDR family oxidoreductase [Corynebacterium anserum]MBC2681528.1 SDR family NAD(P)-dependent oxidoreductase [Corynebacterium anserum]
MKALKYTTETVLITGASSGLGVEFARRLAARGANLVLVARREGRLQALAELLEASYGIKAIALAKDLAVPGAGTELQAELDARGITVTSLINNAGFANYTRFTEVEPRNLHNEIAVNIDALVELTRAYLPRFLERASGFLVNVSSIAAMQPSPGMAAYGASKAFVLNFTEALWAENRHCGVRILALCPGPTDTEFFHVAGSEKADGGMKRMEPEAVVTDCLKTLEKKSPPPSRVVGTSNGVLSSLPGFLPRRVVANAMRLKMDM